MGDQHEIADRDALLRPDAGADSEATVMSHPESRARQHQHDLASDEAVIADGERTGLEGVGDFCSGKKAGGRSDVAVLALFPILACGRARVAQMLEPGPESKHQGIEPRPKQAPALVSS